MLSSNELFKAASIWLVHRGWTVSSFKALTSELKPTPHVFEATKNKRSVSFIIMQHDRFFDPDHFKDFDLIVPYCELTHEREKQKQSRQYALLVFNSSRSYAAFVDDSVWEFHNKLSDGNVVVHRDDVKIVNCPWRIWAMDKLPEWLQRGWPNTSPDRLGEVNRPETWTRHPYWDEKVLEYAETFKRLPTNLKEGKYSMMMQYKWYRVFLEELDEDVLPWSA